MRSRHVVKRGNRYHYVCRVPRDLLHLFPKTTIWKSLKAGEAKDARILAGAEEYRVQQLFLKLRTGMLSKDLEKQLVAMYLKRGIDDLELVATGQAAGIDKAVGEKADELAKRRGLAPGEAKKALANVFDSYAGREAQQLMNQDTTTMDKHMGVVVHYLKEKHGVRLSAKERQVLALKFINSTKQVYEAQAALYRGEWSPLELLREKVERDLATPYYDFKTVLDKYREWYIASKPNVRPGTKADMEVECRVLLEIIGNISIAEMNSMDTVTKLKRVLLKYPLNKQQRYGDRSIHSILRSESSYEVIGLKTANEYLKRAKAVVDYANKNKMLQAANVYQGELFRTDVAAEEQRLGYDDADIDRLIVAICTQQLWHYKPAKPERFWIILIAVFHGFRLGNIVGLTKQDICQTDKGTWVFRLRHGKTKATVRPVAICDSLLLLGFLEWVEKLPRERLFQDSSASFSTWYNRDEKRSDGYIVQGFESRFVTTDKKKCLYSLRHSFAGNVFDVTEDFKITSDMMGHSTGKSVTARYTKRTKAETLKEITDKMQLQHIDLDRLEARAKELFGL